MNFRFASMSKAFHQAMHFSSDTGIAGTGPAAPPLAGADIGNECRAAGPAGFGTGATR
jgi:hypothetical protein